MTTEMKNLRLDDIRIDGGTQSRVAIDEQIVADYAEGYCNGEKMPPVTVFFDGATCWLADGFHRYWANKKIDCEYIIGEVHPGTQRDAILYSVGANASHGLRRTNADKRKAVLIMLEDQEWSGWSDRDIAKRCGVGNEMVSRVRRILCESHSMESDQAHTGEIPQYETSERTYIHPKTGKPATMKTRNIGRSSRSGSPPSPRIAKGALKLHSFHGEDGPVPMRSVSLPLNNPVQAARSMVSLYGDQYMQTLAEEVIRVLQSQKGKNHDNSDSNE